MKKGTGSVRTFFGLATILGGAFLLRILGIGFGLPFTCHADEPIVVNHALAYGTGDLNPHFFKIPPLASYLLAGLYGLFYGIGRAAGVFEGVGDYENLFFSDPTLFYLEGRIVFGALLGTGSVLLLFLLIRRYFSGQAAWMSAFFLTGAFLHVRDSHYIYTDIPLLFVWIAGCFPILKIAGQKGSFRTHLGAGAWIGLAAGLKYNGVFLALPYLVANRMRPMIGKTLGNCLAAGATAFLFYSLSNPYGWLDFETFRREIAMQAHASGFTGFTHHLRYSLHGGVGTPLLAAGIFGLVLSLFKRDRKRVVLAVLVIGYYLVLVLRSQPYDRYVLPLVPWMLFFAADFVSGSTAALPSHARKGAIVLACFLLAAPTLTKSILSDAIFLRKDVRILAKEWMEGNIKPGSRVALEWSFYQPRLKFSKDQLEEKLSASRPEQPFSSAKERRLRFFLAKETEQPRGYELYFLAAPSSELRFSFEEPTIGYDLEDLKAKGINYVLIARTRGNHSHPEFYRLLREQGELVKRFSPYRDSSREYPIDHQPLTGGPFLWRELVERERNGQPLELYRLR